MDKKRNALCAVLCALLAGVPAFAQQAEENSPVETTTVWKRGDNGYYMHRIPAIVCTTKGTLLAFAEGRKNGRGDHGDIDLVVKASTDMGKTWSDFILVHEEGDTKSIAISNPVPVVDRKTGDIILLFRRTPEDRLFGGIFVTRSKDDGMTWSKPEDVSKSVLPDYSEKMATGPGHGLQIKNGKHAGRLCIPTYVWNGKDESSPYPWLRNVMVYSDDGGKTWTHGIPTDSDLNRSRRDLSYQIRGQSSAAANSI